MTQHKTYCNREGAGHSFGHERSRDGRIKQTDERATITVEQAAKRLGVGRNAAYEAVKTGELPSLKIGRRILVPKLALEKLLEAGRVA